MIIRKCSPPVGPLKTWKRDFETKSPPVGPLKQTGNYYCSQCSPLVGPFQNRTSLCFKIFAARRAVWKSAKRDVSFLFRRPQGLLTTEKRDFAKYSPLAWPFENCKTWCSKISAARRGCLKQKKFDFWKTCRLPQPPPPKKKAKNKTKLGIWKTIFGICFRRPQSFRTQKIIIFKHIPEAIGGTLAVNPTNNLTRK